MGGSLKVSLGQGPEYKLQSWGELGSNSDCPSPAGDRGGRWVSVSSPVEVCSNLFLTEFFADEMKCNIRIFLESYYSVVLNRGNAFARPGSIIWNCWKRRNNSALGSSCREVKFAYITHLGKSVTCLLVDEKQCFQPASSASPSGTETASEFVD